VADDTLARIQLVQLEVDRLYSEAQTCGDPERMTAIRQEMEVLLESMREIRREQLNGADRPGEAEASAALVAARPAMNEREERMGSTDDPSVLARQSTSTTARSWGAMQNHVLSIQAGQAWAWWATVDGETRRGDAATLSAARALAKAAYDELVDLSRRRTVRGV
jgi:hypothetical protein